MQTFLPAPSFVASARLLDSRRLGKQRVETLQVLRALVWPVYGWKRHPAVSMWRGFTRALVHYGLAMCAEWNDRGHRDAVSAQLRAFTGGRDIGWAELRDEGLLPPWLGDADFHASHRAMLAAKDPGHYGPHFGGHRSTDPAYVWPPPVFGSWPIHAPSTPCTPAESAALVGGVEPGDHAWTAMCAVHRGRDAELPAGCPRRDVVAAGLSTPGLTAWFTADPELPDEPSLPHLPVSADVGRSIARPPSEDDLEAMRAEIDDPVAFRFFRAGQALPDAARFGLVVLDGSEPDVVPPGVPVLRMVPDAT